MHRTKLFERLNLVITIALVIIIAAIIIMGGVVAYGAVDTRRVVLEGEGTEHQVDQQGEAYFPLLEPLRKASRTNSFVESNRFSVRGDNSGITDHYSKLIGLGEFKVTAYTAGYESTGKHPDDPAYGITASGRYVQENITVAADWSVIPEGSWIYIEGVGKRQVHDIGGAIKGACIDLYIPDLQDALDWGVQQRKVWLIEGEGSLWNETNISLSQE